MSHELRTPLNAIGGYADLLAIGVRGAVTDAQRQDLERLRRANQHMAGLVTDVLNFARLDAGHVEYRADRVRAALPPTADVTLRPVALRSEASGKAARVASIAAGSPLAVRHSVGRWLYLEVSKCPAGTEPIAGWVDPHGLHRVVARLHVVPERQ